MSNQLHDPAEEQQRAAVILRSPGRIVTIPRGIDLKDGRNLKQHAGSLAFRADRGNDSGMPTYHFHIAAEHEDPIPPVAELKTIEANDPYDALEKLRQSRSCRCEN